MHPGLEVKRMVPVTFQCPQTTMEGLFQRKHLVKHEVMYRKMKPWLTYMDSLADQGYAMADVCENMHHVTLSKMVPRSVFIKNCFYSWLKPPKEGAKKRFVISKADMERLFIAAELPFPPMAIY
jgi:hypothetical protein